MRRDGSERTQLTSDPSDNFLREWSADGSELSVTAILPIGMRPDDERILDTPGFAGWDRRSSIGLISADGSGGIRTFKDTEWGTWQPWAWSPSGMEMLLYSDSVGLAVSQREEGGDWNDPVAIADVVCRWGDWSPDAQRILCSEDPQSRVWVLSRSGQVVREFESETVALVDRAQFSTDGSLVYAYVVTIDGVQGIWAFPMSGAEPYPVIVNDDEALSGDCE